jgi:SP family general alpha glucoside:H+ symporter-like MFS transporter
MLGLTLCRYTVMTCLCLIIAFTAIFFTAKDVVALQVAEILCGIPWGVFQTLTITYASEVCPVALRGYRKFIGIYGKRKHSLIKR